MHEVKIVSDFCSPLWLKLKKLFLLHQVFTDISCKDSSVCTAFVEVKYVFIFLRYLFWWGSLELENTDLNAMVHCFIFRMSNLMIFCGCFLTKNC